MTQPISQSAWSSAGHTATDNEFDYSWFSEAEIFELKGAIDQVFEYIPEDGHKKLQKFIKSKFRVLSSPESLHTEKFKALHAADLQVKLGFYGVPENVVKSILEAPASHHMTYVNDEPMVYKGEELAKHLTEIANIRPTL